MIIEELENKYNDLQKQIHNLESEQTELLKDYVENDLGIKRNTLFKINNVEWFEGRTLVYADNLIIRIFMKEHNGINRFFCQKIDIEALKKWDIEIIGQLDKDLDDYLIQQEQYLMKNGLDKFNG